MGRESRQSPLLISCGILKPEIEALIEGKKIEAEAIFLNKYLHMDYQKLQDALKASLRKHSGKKPVAIYGDLCLGFNGEMNALMAEYDIVKVDALNCIDCLLGGRGKLLQMDPEHRFYFLTAGFLDFTEKLILGSKEDNRHRFNMLKGIIVLDSLGDIDRYWDRIEHISDQTGLPVLEHCMVGLDGLKAVIEAALKKATIEINGRHQLDSN
jgi:hypothetical protein